MACLSVRSFAKKNTPQRACQSAQQPRNPVELADEGERVPGGHAEALHQLFGVDGRALGEMFLQEGAGVALQEPAVAVLADEMLLDLGRSDPGAQVVGA